MNMWTQYVPSDGEYVQKDTNLSGLHMTPVMYSDTDVGNILDIPDYSSSSKHTHLKK